MKKLLLLCIFLAISLPRVFAQPAVHDTTNTTTEIGPMKATVGDNMQPAKDFLQNAALVKELSLFYNFIMLANLTETYKSKGPITIFAPANEAFADLPPGKLDSLANPAHIWELTHLVTYHAVAGKFNSKELQKQITKHKGSLTLTTLGGGELIITVDSNRNIVLEDENGGKSVISRFDILQSNGVLHVINKVLIPKPKAA